MKLISASVLTLCLYACQTPNAQVSTTVFNTAESHDPYQVVLKNTWRSTTVFSNYETLYMLNAAAFSDEFYEAFKNSQGERFASTNRFANIKKNSTFFVSIYSPNEEYNDMSNAAIWEFTLSVDGKIYPAKLVKEIKEKEAWSSFFPFITRWSTDFIVSFEIPQSENFSKDTKYTLSLSNAQAKTLMTW